MPRFIKTKKYLINIDNIAFIASGEVVNEYNSTRYWVMRIKLNDGAILECETVDTAGEMEQMISNLYKEINR
ncbi:hypothetical protein PSAR109036_01895 [Psychrobacter arenosus]